MKKYGIVSGYIKKKKSSGGIVRYDDIRPKF